jgi:ribosomal protein S12 methylthiotransferase
MMNAQEITFQAKPVNYIPKVGFVSLGCPKALVDSELILTQLKAEGYETSKSFEGADIVVVNTCGFIDAAVKESLDTIGEALAANGKVIVTGCLGAKSGADGGNLIAGIHPKVLAVTGPHAKDEVMQAIHLHVPKPHDPFTDLVPDHGVKLTPKHYAYLKISEGCNHRCSFCIIPSMRGDLVSRPIGEVVREAHSLVKSGVKELLVISQDTSAYGVDIKYRTDFVDGRPVRTRMTELVQELAKLDVWVRLHYVYPYPHVDEVMDLMAGYAAKNSKILPYLDVPLQHAHPDVLKRMKRPASGEKNIERILQWRQTVPNLVIRSTFIAGFPGETEEEFQYLLDFLKEAQLDRVGCFAYSPVDGASANALENPVPEDIKQARVARFMAVQADISRGKLKARIGQTLEVLVDVATAQGGIGRSYADAPEIDGVVHIAPPDRPSKRYKAGEFIRVKITGSNDHDLTGYVV